MQVPEELRKCVVFVCFKNKQGELIRTGTAFFITVPVSESLSTTYLVTARHVIGGIQRDSRDGKVLLRVNLKDKPSIFIDSHASDWVFHPDDSSIDVAVMPVAFPQDVDYLPIPIDSAATEEIIQKNEIGVGEKVFLTGLFVNHYGKQRNLPIIRVGNIALMPEEKVETRDFGSIDAYLVESRSLGGMSGSPVFVYLGYARGVGSLVHGGFTIGPLDKVYYWLGLMHGHWDAEIPASDMLMEDSSRVERVNLGIAIVVPVTKILEVVNQEALVTQRQEDAEILRRRTLPVPDAAREGDEALTPAQFEETLKRVSRRISPLSEPAPEELET